MVSRALTGDGVSVARSGSFTYEDATGQATTPAALAS
jgi:hypothetical protein